MHAVSLYPFGTAEGDQTLSSGDDANSGLISLATNAVFYGKSIKDVIVRMLAIIIIIIIIISNHTDLSFCFAGV